MENYCLSKRLRKQHSGHKTIVKIYEKYKKERKIAIIFKTVFFYKV
jgi:hypothetical protein